MTVASAANPDSDSSTALVVDSNTNHPAARPASLRRSAAIVTSAFFVSVFLTGSLAWRGGEQFTGSLTADVSRIESPASGVVEWQGVQPGQVVLPGEELFIVRDTGLTEELERATETLKRLNNELTSALARCDLEVNTRSTSINSAVFDAELTLAGLLREQFQCAFETKAVDRSRELYDALVSIGPSPINLKSLAQPRATAEESALIAIVERASDENERETIAARISLCESRLQDLTAGRESLQKTVQTAFGIDSLKSNVEQASARVDELRAREEELKVRSPVYGMAGLVRATEGSDVQNESLLLEVFDRDREFVAIDLPSRVASTLTPGDIVELHFPGNETLAGRIEAVPPQVSMSDRQSQADPTISLRIRPTGRAWPTLPIGTSIGVTLLPSDDE